MPRTRYTSAIFSSTPGRPAPRTGLIQAPTDSDKGRLRHAQQSYCNLHVILFSLAPSKLSFVRGDSDVIASTVFQYVDTLRGCRSSSRVNSASAFFQPNRLGSSSFWI